MGRRYFEDDADYDRYWADRMSERRCSCKSYSEEPCDYCTDPNCHECGHEECPSDCFCECNDNVDPDEVDENE